jgi:F0F1-type ATP synthase epsilon subunit
MEVFQVFLLSPSGGHFAGKVWQVAARDRNGMFAVRAHHERFIAPLPPGTIEIAVTAELRSSFKIGEGILEFRDNICTVMCETVKKIDAGG